MEEQPSLNLARFGRGGLAKAREFYMSETHLNSPKQRKKATTLISSLGKEEGSSQIYLRIFKDRFDPMQKECGSRTSN